MAKAIGSDRNIEKRIQSGWYSWRKITGMIYDKNVPENAKGKMYKAIVRPTMLYDIGAVAMTKRQEGKMEIAEIKMLRFSVGVTRLDRLRNEEIRVRIGHDCVEQS